MAGSVTKVSESQYVVTTGSSCRVFEDCCFNVDLIIYWWNSLLSYGIAMHGDENRRNCILISTKLFRSSLEVPYANKDTPVVRGD